MSAEKFQQYQTQRIMTASPAQLVFMLYEKAIGCLHEAIRAIAEADIEARWRANGRAMEIIDHMQMTLNTEQGGEIADNLDRLFGFLLRRLPRVDVKNDPKPAEEAIALLEPLRESWRQLAEKGNDVLQGEVRKAAENAARQTAVATQAEPSPAAERSQSAPAARAPQGYGARGAPQGAERRVPAENAGATGGVKISA